MKTSVPVPQPIHVDVCSVVLSSLDNDKAEEAVVIDLAGKSDIADTMIIASGRSSRHVHSIAEHLLERLKQAGCEQVSIEGQREGNWVLLDAGNVVVHVFRPEVRAYYNLEKMWAVTLPQ